MGKQVCTRTMAAGVLAALNGSKKRINQHSASFRLMRAFFQARPLFCCTPCLPPPVTLRFMMPFIHVKHPPVFIL